VFFLILIHWVLPFIKIVVTHLAQGNSCHLHKGNKLQEIRLDVEEVVATRSASQKPLWRNRDFLLLTRKRSGCVLSGILKSLY